MRDILTDGLPILDLLEITPSTRSVAALTNCDQSSVSRIYRHVSESLQLGFRKCNGTYRAHSNRELLASLRQATQLLRSQRGPEHLQWVAAPWNGPAVAQMHEANPLPRRWEGEQRTLELLESRVLDLAVVEVQTVPVAETWSPVPLAHYPTCLRQALVDPASAMAQEPAAGTPQQICTDVALVRRELLERPAIQALIDQLRRGYRQAYSHLEALHWT